jgi:hypothetical protein
LQLSFLLLLASAIRSSSSPPNDPFLGISPQDEKYYKSSSEIKCKDGSKKFTKAQLNDDFCDCSDGTDEPGSFHFLNFSSSHKHFVFFDWIDSSLLNKNCVAFLWFRIVIGFI